MLIRTTVARRRYRVATIEIVDRGEVVVLLIVVVVVVVFGFWLVDVISGCYFCNSFYV